MIKVLIAEDSSTIRFILKKILATDAEIQVVGEATNGVEAVELTNRLKPDLVTMDIRMPKKNGFEATKDIMKTCPTPILVISSSVNDDDLKITFNAIKAGALDILEKPKGNLSADFEKIGARIIRKIKLLSEVKVITQRHRKTSDSHTDTDKVSFQHKIPKLSKKDFKLVTIVSSTGGPKALNTILKDLPANFPLPIVVVQHITPGFGSGLVSWLDKESDMRVKTAEANEILQGGTVYFAPDDFHLKLVENYKVELSKEKEVMGLRPYGNYLFFSVAEKFASETIAVILTGMGRDGADGMKKLHDLGAHTIGQDEESCVVYGMPKEAMELGAIDSQLHLNEIANYLQKVVQKG